MRHSQKHKNVIFLIKIPNIITNKIKYIGYIKMINNIVCPARERADSAHHPASCNRKRFPYGRMMFGDAQKTRFWSAPRRSLSGQSIGTYNNFSIYL